MIKTDKVNYITVKISGVIISIGKEDSNIKGYCEVILESFLPTEEEMENWSKAQEVKWIKENNERMEAICEFLNNRN